MVWSVWWHWNKSCEINKYHVATIVFWPDSSWKLPTGSFIYTLHSHIVTTETIYTDNIYCQIYTDNILTIYTDKVIKPWSAHLQYALTWLQWEISGWFWCLFCCCLRSVFWICIWIFLLLVIKVPGVVVTARLFVWLFFHATGFHLFLSVKCPEMRVFVFLLHMWWVLFWSGFG